MASLGSYNTTGFIRSLLLPSQGAIPSYDGSRYVSTVKSWGLGSGAGYSMGILLESTTPATAGATTQVPPLFVIGGQAWDTDDLISKNIRFGLGLTLSSGTSPFGTLDIRAQIAGGAWGSIGCTFTTAGTASLKNVIATTMLRVSGDGGGSASTLTFTNVTAAPGSTSATLSNTPTGIAGASAGWFKVFVGATAAYVPYWTA